MKNLVRLLTFVLLVTVLGWPQSQINQFQILRLGTNSAPANPPVNASYVYFNGTTMVCVTSTGASCLASGSGTVTSVGLAGTANQITVTGSTPITGSGSWTLSLPSSLVLPSATTATTQSVGDNSTKVATTAFVLANSSTGGPTYSTIGIPAAPTLATIGSAGSTSDTYKIVACQDTACTLHSAASSASTIATANATLSASNYNVISGYQIYGANCYNIYRTAAGGTPSTTGKIASCVGLQYADKGAAGDSSTAPSTDNTILVSNPWPLPGCAIAIGGLTGPDAPPCTPNAKDDEMFETASFPDPRWTVGGSGLGTGTFTATNSTWVYAFQPGNGADLWAPVLQATPSNPWTFTQKSVYTRTIGVTNNQIVGMCVTDGTGSSNKIIDFDVKADSSINVNQWSNSTSFSSTPFNQGVSWLNTLAPIYLRIQDDGTNLKFSLSQDGRTFQQVYSQARLSFLASVADIGFCGESTSTSATPSIAMYWFRRTQ